MIKHSSSIKILSRIAFLLAILLIGLCIRLAYTTYLFPIYPDEIAERILLSRIGYDFPIKFDLMPMCHALSSAYPKLWYLPGFFDWLLYSQIFNLKTFRFVGILLSWCVFLLLSVQVSYKNINVLPKKYSKFLFFLLILGCTLAFFNMGVVPFSLVTNRPETVILFWLILSVIFFERPVTTNVQKVWVTTGFFICITMLLYAHAKTFLLTPVFCIIAHRLFSHFKNKYIYLSLWILFVLILVNNYFLWTSTFTLCPDSAAVNKIFASFNVDLHHLLNNTKLFFLELYNNLLDYQVEIDRITLQSAPEVNYLPSLTVTPAINLFNQLLKWNYLVLFFILLIANSISYGRNILRHQFITLNLLSLTLIVCSFFNVLINSSKHWYDAAYLWSLFVVAGMIYCSGQIPHLLKRKTTYLAMIYFFIMAIISVSILIKEYEPLFLNGFSGPSISLVNYDYKKTKNNLDNLARLCGIDPEHSNNLIVDDLTYHHFQKSKYPLAYTYLFYGSDQYFLSHFWNKFQIDGLIIRAAHVPEPLRNKYATQIGSLICIPKKNIEAFFKEKNKKNL